MTFLLGEEASNYEVNHVHCTRTHHMEVENAWSLGRLLSFKNLGGVHVHVMCSSECSRCSWCLASSHTCSVTVAQEGPGGLHGSKSLDPERQRSREHFVWSSLQGGDLSAPQQSWEFGMDF